MMEERSQEPGVRSQKWKAKEFSPWNRMIEDSTLTFEAIAPGR
jgi:hypothetical protein